MIDYNDIYEMLRKEKYDEQLQAIPKSFLVDFSEYLRDRREETSDSRNLFVDSVAKSRKQFENAIALFKELILRRKKKLLNLVFIANETGIMKRDYENMLDIEKEDFDRLVKAFEDGDKKVAQVLNGTKEADEKNKMILFGQDVEQFVDFDGKDIGPFSSGELVNLDAKVAQVLVDSGKASFVD